MKEPCYGQLEDDRVCNGEPVYRKYKDKKCHFGKTGFIGCSNWIRGQTTKHRFLNIPKDVKEALVKELFESEDGDFSKKISTKKCARVLHPRSGGKGHKECCMYGCLFTYI